MSESTLAYALSAGLKTLSYRVLTLTGLVLNAVIFGWAMHTGTWVAVADAVAFGGITWALVKVSPFRESAPTGQ